MKNQHFRWEKQTNQTLRSGKSSYVATILTHIISFRLVFDCDLDQGFYITYATWHIRWNSPSSGWIPKSPEASKGTFPNQPLVLWRKMRWPRNDKLAETSCKNKMRFKGRLSHQIKPWTGIISEQLHGNTHIIDRFYRTWSILQRHGKAYSEKKLKIKTWEGIFRKNLKSRLTENDEGASYIWKPSPVTSSCPCRFGNISPLDIHRWTCNAREDS